MSIYLVVGTIGKRDISDLILAKNGKDARLVAARFHSPTKRLRKTDKLSVVRMNGKVVLGGDVEQ